MVSSVLPLRFMSGFGRRKRRVGGRKRRMSRYGGRKMKMMIQGSGRRRKRHRVRRTHRGGFFGSILKGIHGIARSVPIVSTALGATGNPVASGVARALGYGRHRKRYGGRMSVYGGARRKTRMFSVFGGRKRRRVRRRRHRKTRRGRGLMDLLKKGHSLVKQHGLISKGLSHFGQDKYAGVAKALGYGRKRKRRMRGGFMGIIPLAMGRGRRRKHKRRHRRGGRRKRYAGLRRRTYPMGLLLRRR